MGAGTVPLAIFLVFLGCASNVVFLEMIVKEDTGAGNIVTFCQFLFVAVEGLVFVSHFFTIPPIIPISKYVMMVTLYFFVSVLNNYSLVFDIPMPLHMIFRAGSLMASMILGIVLLKKRYPVSKYLSVVMISVGISIATLASARQMQEEDDESLNGESEAEKDGTWRIIKLICGIAFLLLALFLSAFMGIYQEKIYAAHGKHARESMFYNHALPLPGFLLLAPNIWSKMQAYSASTPVSLGPVSLPHMWVYLLANCITQFSQKAIVLNQCLRYVCIRGVFTLTTQCTALFVTLVVTLRKFFSLLVSIFYFQNPFTTQHWLATVLVFTGTLLFSGTLQTVGRTVLGLDREKKKTT